MVKLTNPVEKSSGEKDISRLGNCIFARMQDMALREVVSIEITLTSMSYSVVHIVDCILEFSH